MSFPNRLRQYRLGSSRNTVAASTPAAAAPVLTAATVAGSARTAAPIAAAGMAEADAAKALRDGWQRAMMPQSPRDDTDFESAEGFTAEAFLQAYKNLTAGRVPRDPSKLGPWLRGIARNRYLEDQRRRGRSAAVPEDFEQDTYETLSNCSSSTSIAADSSSATRSTTDCSISVTLIRIQLRHLI